MAPVQSPIRGVRRLTSRLARLEANIAKSTDSSSACFVTNVASGRAQRAAAENSSRSRSKSRPRTRRGVGGEREEDDSHNSGRQLDRHKFGAHTAHVSRTNSSELVPVEEEPVSRAKSVPRSRHSNNRGNDGEDDESRRSAVQARREIFEQRASAAGTPTKVPANSKRRASTASTISTTSLTSTNTGSPATPPKSFAKSATFGAKGSNAPGVSILRDSTSSRPSECEYDYLELKDKWTVLSSPKKEKKKVVVADMSKREAFLKRLKSARRSQAMTEPQIVRSVKRRGSTGKMTALKPLVRQKSIGGKVRKLRQTFDPTRKAQRQDHSAEPTRRVTRRNSMGNARLVDEPVVTLFWNPARSRLLDPVAQVNGAMGETEEGADASTPTMYDRGIVQRRASTGRIRLDEEDTTWLYAREDHEIAEAAVRGSKQHQKQHDQNKSKEKMEAAKVALQSQSSHGKSNTMPFRRKMSVASFGKPSQHKPDNVTEEALSDDDTAEQPRRRVERRGSTGAVPLAEEADSRLHRKKKMRQEHKRRQKAVNLSREGKSVKPDASGESRPKASLLGLLDPSMALDDGRENPSSWLAGDEEHVFTIAPYKPPGPKYRKAQKLTPRELELDLDGDSSDEESDDDFATQFVSPRSMTSRGKSFPGKAKNDPGDDKTQTTEDSDDDGDEFATHVFGGRPGSTRGTSFTQKRQDITAKVRNPPQTPESDSDSDSDDDVSRASFFGGRPGATRGTSFLKKRETSPKRAAKKAKPAESDSDDDSTSSSGGDSSSSSSSSSDACPASFFGGRPGATRGTSFMKKRQKSPEPVVKKAEDPESDGDDSSSDACPTSFFGSRPAKTRGTSFMKKRDEPVDRNAKSSRLSRVEEDPSNSESTEPTLPVPKVAERKLRPVSEKIASSSQRASSEKTSTSSSRQKVPNDKSVPPSQKAANGKSSSSSQKAPVAPKTPMKKKKALVAVKTPGNKKSTVSTTKTPIVSKASKSPARTKKVSSTSTTARVPKSPAKSPKKQPKTPKKFEVVVSPSRTLHGSPLPPNKKQIPLAPNLDGKPRTKPKKVRRNSTSAVPRINDDSLTKSNHTASSVSSDDERRLKRGAKSDKRLLKALALISQADKSEVKRALDELGETGSAVEVLKGEKLRGSRKDERRKTKLPVKEKEKRGKKAPEKARTKG